jgi:hypothetical protein
MGTGWTARRWQEAASPHMAVVRHIELALRQERRCVRD